ncbi:hypothetical protein Emag_005412 [Eimeria magna]
MSRKADVGGALAFGGSRVPGTAASGARGGRRRELREEQKIEIKEAFELFDAEKTGKMDYHELKALTQKFLDRDPSEELLKAFRLFDDDDTGKISLKNLRRVARELGENLSDDELQAMIDEFDRDMDGEISQEEFMSIMKQTSLYQ